MPLPVKPVIGVPRVWIRVVTAEVIRSFGVLKEDNDASDLIINSLSNDIFTAA